MAFTGSSVSRADNLYLTDEIRKILIRTLTLKLEQFFDEDFTGERKNSFSELIAFVLKKNFKVSLETIAEIKTYQHDSFYERDRLKDSHLELRCVLGVIEDELSGAIKKRILKRIFKEVLDALLKVKPPKVPKNHSFAVASQKLVKTLGINEDWLKYLNLCVLFKRKSVLLEFFDEANLSFEENFEEFCYALDFRPEVMKRVYRELDGLGFLARRRSGNYYFELSDNLASVFDPYLKSDPASWLHVMEASSSLKSEDFQIEKKDGEFLKRLISNDLNRSVNILLYGEPGTGKTSLVRCLAYELDFKVFSVASDVDATDADRRFALYTCVEMSSRIKGKKVVLVDEAERMLNTSFSNDLDSDRGTSKDKAWLNAFLEQKKITIIWISNQVAHVDQAVRRRFDFSLYFPELNEKQQKKIFLFVLKKHDALGLISRTGLNTLNRNFRVPVSVMDRSVECARSLCNDSKNEFTSLLKTQLMAYVSLKEDGIASYEMEKKVKEENKDRHSWEDYTTEVVNFNCDIKSFISGFKRLHEMVKGGKKIERGLGTILFYGPPGTGKTELGHYLAKITRRKLVIKKASDLLNCYVGMSEKQIASAFNELDIRKEILLIDEVDSFLYSRSSAERSWEKTLVNEFLTQLQDFRGILICTTNLIDGLDKAVMRRFTTKLQFKYAQGKPLELLFENTLRPLSEKSLSDAEKARLKRIGNLTPGDFKVVKGKFSSLFMNIEKPTNLELIEALEEEVKLKDLKNTSQRRIGFI